MNCALVDKVAAINCSLAMNNELTFWSTSAMILLCVCHEFCSQSQWGLILQTFWNTLSFDPKYILLNPHDSIIFENNLNKVAAEYLQTWMFVVLACMFEKYPR